MWEFKNAVESREKLKKEITITVAAHIAFHSSVFLSYFLFRTSCLVIEAQKTMTTSLNAILISVQ